MNPYQSPQSRPQPGPQVQQMPDVLLVGDEPPKKVFVAMRFVEMCNQSMGWMPMGMDSEGEIAAIERELHYKQEAAFSLACQYLGEYFAEDLHGGPEFEEWVQPLSVEDQAGGEGIPMAQKIEGSPESGGELQRSPQNGAGGDGVQGQAD